MSINQGECQSRDSVSYANHIPSIVNPIIYCIKHRRQFVNQENGKIVEPKCLYCQRDNVDWFLQRGLLAEHFGRKTKVFTERKAKENKVMSREFLRLAKPHRPLLPKGRPSLSAIENLNDKEDLQDWLIMYIKDNMRFSV